MSLAVAGLALSGVSAAAQYRAGQANAAGLVGQAQGLEVQADFVRLKGKQDALKHKRQAVDQLQGILEALARKTAVSARGYADPFSGNPEGIARKTLNVGGLNFITASENADIVRLVADGQAAQYEYSATRARAAAKSAKQAGMMNALFTLGSAGVMYGMSGGFDGFFGKATSPTLNTPVGFGANVPSSMGAAPPGSYFGTGPNFMNPVPGLSGVYSL